jgi:hypothetical protein
MAANPLVSHALIARMVVVIIQLNFLSQLFLFFSIMIQLDILSKFMGCKMIERYEEN